MFILHDMRFVQLNQNARICTQHFAKTIRQAPHHRPPYTPRSIQRPSNMSETPKDLRETVVSPPLDPTVPLTTHDACNNDPPSRLPSPPTVTPSNEGPALPPPASQSEMDSAPTPGTDLDSSALDPAISPATVNNTAAPNTETSVRAQTPASTSSKTRYVLDSVEVGHKRKVAPDSESTSTQGGSKKKKQMAQIPVSMNPSPLPPKPET